MRSICFAIAVLGVVGATGSADDKHEKPKQLTARDVGSSVIFIGHCGRPVGETIEIHGKKILESKDSGMAFEVDSVNGTALKPAVRVSIPGIEEWPQGTEAKIRGQERGRLRYTDIKRGGWRTNDPRFVLRQELVILFVAETTLSPANLKISKRALEYWD